jgi:hypothetical protein
LYKVLYDVGEAVHLQVSEEIFRAALEEANILNPFPRRSARREGAIKRRVVDRLARENSVPRRHILLVLQFAEVVKRVRLSCGDLIADRLLSGSGPVTDHELRRLKTADVDRLTEWVKAVSPDVP